MIDPGHPPAEIERLPASALQKGLWIAGQLAGSDAAYNLSHADRINGELDIVALQRALQAVAERHPSLRTSLEIVDGTPQQVVLSQVRLTLTVTDLSDRGANVGELAVEELIQRRLRQPFDLSRAPLARAELFKLSANEHVLLLTMHHLVFDGWSHSILKRELGAFYAGFAAGKASCLPAPAPYADYVWQEAAGLGEARMQAHLDYWRARLAGHEPTTLPTDRPRAPRMSSHGEVEHFHIPESCVTSLRVLARKEKCTLFMVLLAAFQTLLMRYSGRDDVSVGCPSAGRFRARFPGTIGFLSNTLVMRTSLAGNPKFRQLLARTRDTVLGALAHQELPTDRLVTELGLARDPERNPLYAVVFALQTQPDAELQIEGTRITPLPIHSGIARLDAWFTLRECGQALLGEVEFRTDLFDRETIRRVITHFRTLLHAVSADPDKPVGSVPLLGADEHRRMVFEWNDTQRAFPLHRGIHELIAERAGSYPAAPAVALGQDRLTYDELDARANALALRLRDLGVGRGVPVAVCLDRSFELIVALLAVFKSGGVFLPLDPEYPCQRLQFMLADSGARVIVSQRSLRDAIGEGANGGPAVLFLDEIALALGVADFSSTPCAPEDGAYLIYTSGSSGDPKGVLVPHRGLCNHICWLAEQLQLTGADRFLQKTSISFDASIGEMLAPLLAGATVVLAGPGEHRDMARLVQTLIEQKVTVLLMVPTALRVLLDEAALCECRSLRYLISGGEALDRELARHVFRVLPGITLGNFYGPSEASDDTTYFELRAPPQGVGNVPIGWPIANVRCHAVDGHLQPVPVGVVGELLIGGAGLACGYVNRPELTQQRFIVDPLQAGERLYRSGDLVRYLPDGSLEFVGRADSQVKVRGVRVEPGEIEAVLNALQGITQSVVVARDEGLRGTCLYAFVTGNAIDIPATYQALRSQLPSPLIPSAIVALESLPLLPNGKVDRDRLPTPQPGVMPVEYVPPQGATEESVAAIWQEVLHLQSVGSTDNFFDLGGHSLLATQVISRIRQFLHVDLPLRALFESPTVAGLARHITDRQGLATHLVEPAIEPVQRDHPLATSFSQRRMWFVQQIEPAGTSYNMPFALRIKGRLDRNAYLAAVETIIRRHEAFRTTFVVAGAEPVQLIATPAPLQVREIDLRHFSPEDRVPETERIFRAESMRPFDLAEGPLYRFLLVQLDDADHAMLWLVHHAISDQWSAGIVGRELAALYSGMVNGEMPVLEPLQVQYADFAAWQRIYLGGDSLTRQVAYWRDKLAGVRPLALPTDYPRPPRQTSRGSWVFQKLSATTIAALKRVCAEHRVTPFMALLACFKILLWRHSGQVDIAVGCPVANRTRLATESLVGTLVNTLVLRTSLECDPTFRDLLVRTRENALEAFANQDVPFERLVEELHVDRDAGRAPLVQVLFNVPNAPMRKLDLDGLDVEVFDFDNGSTQFELAASVDLDFTGRIALTYSTDLFTPGTASRMLTQYVTLIEQVTADQAKRLSEYSILGENDKRLILRDWNRTQRPYPERCRADELISAQAARTPQAIAVACGARRLTYARLESRSNQLAHYLRQAGLGAGARVGICMERSPEMLVALLAVQKVGAAYVPLDPAFPQERLEFMAHDAALDATVSERSLQSLPAHLPGPIIVVDERAAEIAAQPESAVGYTGDPDNLAYILYTSGSTGVPKGVEISCRALTNLLCSMCELPGCNSSDTLLSVTTLSFDISALELYLPLIAGGRVEIATRSEAADPALLIDRIAACRPSIMQATPTTWRLLIEAGWPGNRDLKILCGGETLTRQLADRLLERCGSLWNMYGPTETTIWSSLAQIEPDTATITIGRPIANTSLYILDERLQPVPIGATGELWIGGHGVAAGYHRRPDLTRERFIANPFRTEPRDRLYRTGDLARFLEDGRVVHLGRADTQVKIRGFRIELGEIESALAQHPAVAQAAVAARAGSDGQQELVAYIVAHVGEQPSADSMRSMLKPRLPTYMVPTHFVPLDSLPLTANGKVDLNNLPAPASVSRPAEVAGPRELPVSPLEAQLTALWRRVLQNDSITVHDNFFDSGGHSLKAVELFTHIHEAFGIRLPLATLFQAPTIAEMTRVLHEGGVEPSRRCVVAIQTGGREVPFFAVPGVGGDVLVFAKLARILGADRPFFGLQAPGLSGLEKPISSVEECARRFVREILAVRPRGPYLIGGTCTGGVYAYEVAQQLSALGEDVTLAVMEAWHPTSYVRAGLAANLLWPVLFVCSKLALYSRGLSSLPLSDWGSFLKSKARRVATALFRTDTPEFHGDGTFVSTRVVRTTLQAVANYKPKPYAGPVLNVIAGTRSVPPNARDTRRTWTELASGPNRTVVIPAEDSGRLFVSPHVEVLAELLSTYARGELPLVEAGPCSLGSGHSSVASVATE